MSSDGIDQLDHVADAGCCLRQLANAIVGLAGLIDGLVGHPRRILDLTADFVDGRRHFLSRRRHRLNVGGGFLRRRRNHAGKLLRTLRGRGQRSRRSFELRRCRRYGFDDLADRALKIVGELDHVRLASNGDALCGVLLLFAVETKFGLHGLHISQRDTDLVVLLDDDAAVEQALSDFRHRPVELFKRPSDGPDGLKA